MCGICGLFKVNSNRKVDRLTLRNMVSTLVHRGPDDEGIYINDDDSVGLWHRRLSIIDLSTGHQPMSNLSEDIWIVFNGEIYNFQELKKNLQAKGYHFRTSSDTEVIINSYEEYGESAFADFNGIFAFALYDKRNRFLILCRDQFGVKPLYYSFSSEHLIFASEIKTIFQEPSISKALNYEALNSFLTFRYNPSPQTLFHSVKKLTPGYFLKVTKNGDVLQQPYCNYAPSTNTDISETEAIQEYQNLLEKAVQRQMISDVPIGLLLSGGIDSATIGYLMQKYSNQKIKTFTIGFVGKGDFNELEDARRTAKFIGSEHHDITLTQKEYLDFFLQSFFYMEEPIAETSISALYYVSKLAKEYVKVVLAGQGADEPLAGYNRYIGLHYLSKFAYILQKLPLENIAKLLSRNEKINRAAYAAKFSTELKRFLGVYTIFTQEQKKLLCNEEVRQRLRDVDEVLIERLYSQTSGLLNSVSKMLFIDTRLSLSDDLLLFGDKMTMANSIEMRVPFLDINLVQFVESLPFSLKIKGMQSKYIHKYAAQKWLPKEIILRKKKGFETPLDEWLQSNLAETAKTWFNSKDSICSNYFNLDYINNMIDLHQSHKVNFQRHIFILLSFEMWYRNFFKVNSNDLV